MGPMKGKLGAAVAALMAVFALHTASAMAWSVTAGGSLQTTQAGAHGDVTIDATFPDVVYPVTSPARTGDLSTNPRNLTIHLPSGVLGDPSGPQVCTAAEFANDQPDNVTSGCPSSSQVGEVKIDAYLSYNNLDVHPTASIYLIEPRGAEPARLGIFIPTLVGKPLHIESPISVRTTSDYGLDSAIVDIPTKVDSTVSPGTQYDLYTTHMQIKLWGSPADHASLGKPFMVNPTTCEPATGSISATSYGAPDTAVTASFNLGTTTGCDNVPFTPTISTNSPLKADQPNGLDVSINFPNDTVSGTTAQSHLKKAVVTLPQGIAMSPGVASGGLEGCTNDQFAIDKDVDPSCPDLSQLGTVTMSSPLVGDLTGKVFLGMPESGKPFRLLGYAKKGDVRVKIAGYATPDPTTGQLTTVFENLPRQPFTKFVLSFRGGDNAVLVAPRTCGTQDATAVFTPYSGTADVTSTASITTSDCVSAGFGPSLGAALSPTLGAAGSHLKLTIDRGDGQSLLSTMKITLPPGQLGYLFAFPSCSITDARAGDCSDASKVGDASVSVGTGNKPLALPGKVYLVGPYDGGVGGLAVVVPAKVGPLDLGTVVSVTKLQLRDGDLALEATTEPLPTIQAGIPLQIRNITLDLNRDGFLLNGTSCTGQPVSATFGAVGGGSVMSTASLGLTGCAGLPFAPKLSTTLSGSRTYPALSVHVATNAGDANLARVQLALPKTLGVNLKAVQGGCMADQFAAGNCPASSIIGTVKATSPLINTPLSGPVRLVQVKGKTLPNLYMDLNGFIHLPLTVTNAFVNGAIQSTVEGIPDVPVSSFDLSLNGGTKGLLQASSSTALCASPPSVGAVMFGQNNAAVKATSKPTVACGLFVKKTVGSLRGFGKHRTPSLSLKFYGNNLKSMKVTFPKALKIEKRHFKKGARGRAGGKNTKVRRTTKSTISITTAKKHGTGSLQLVLNKGALRRGKGLKVNHRLTIKVRLVDTKGHAKTVNVKITPKR